MGEALVEAGTQCATTVCMLNAVTILLFLSQVFIQILSEINPRSLVRLARTSKAFLSLVFDPSLWRTLDSSSLSSRLNLTQLLVLLKRPQFRLLTKLGLPRKVKLGKKGLKSISGLCPRLEWLDAGW